MVTAKKSRFEHQLWVQRWLCYYCDKSMAIATDGTGKQTPDQASRDHYVAQSKGGRVVVAACVRCNNLKGDTDANQFKETVQQLLQNPHIDAIWHRDIDGLQSILARIIQVERWKEKQKNKPNHYRQQRIDKEIVTIVRLIRNLKP